uniref:Transmembrane protein n=1 Tax=Medicago truncatula TaxID=3880 RepID=I3T7X5_MEDTR|nr:unknown [Medicago truncatula]
MWIFPNNNNTLNHFQKLQSESSTTTIIKEEGAPLLTYQNLAKHFNIFFPFFSSEYIYFYFMLLMINERGFYEEVILQAVDLDLSSIDHIT